MKKFFIVILMCMTISTVHGYTDDSIALTGGIGGIALMSAALAQGKCNQQSVLMFIGGVVLLGIGHKCASNKEHYTMPVLIGCSAACLVGWLAGIAPKQR